MIGPRIYAKAFHLGGYFEAKGGYVEHSDYAAKEAECERLREQLATLQTDRHDALADAQAESETCLTNLIAAIRERDEWKRKAEGLQAAIRSAHIAEGNITNANSIGYHIGFAAAIAHIEGVAGGTSTPPTPPPADDARDAEDADLIAVLRHDLTEHRNVLSRVTAERDSLAEDARRYRWLRDSADGPFDGPIVVMAGDDGDIFMRTNRDGRCKPEFKSHADLDAAIDRAIAAMAKDGAE